MGQGGDRDGLVSAALRLLRLHLGLDVAFVAHASEQDRPAVAGREWYWLPAAGISTSALDVKAVERALGRGTTRTINTVARLHARLTPGPNG